MGAGDQGFERPRHAVRVVLERLGIDEGPGPWRLGPCEVALRTTVIPDRDGDAARVTRLPRSGAYPIADGEQRVEALLYVGMAETDGELEIVVEGARAPAAEDRGTYRRRLCGDPRKWARCWGPGEGHEDAPRGLRLWVRVEVGPAVREIAATGREAGVFVERDKHFRRFRSNARGELREDLWRWGLGARDRLRGRPPDDDPGGPAPAGKLRAQLTGAEAAELSVASDPAPRASLGSLDRFVRVDSRGPLADVHLKLAIGPEEARHVDPTSLRVFRYDPVLEKPLLVSRSGPGANGDYVWARIHEPGIYGVYGLPRDRATLLTIQLLRLAHNAAPIYEAAGIEFKEVHGRICQMILCDRTIRASGLLDDPRALEKIGMRDLVGDPRLLFGEAGLGIVIDPSGEPSVPPRPPPPGELPGGRRPRTICEECTGLSVPITADWDPPEIQIIGEPWPIRPDISVIIGPRCEKWVSIGPTSTKGGWGPSAAGRAKSVAFGSDGTAYVGSSEGGVWKSTDRARSWQPTMHGELSLSIGSVAVAPSDPSVVYAATGEYAPSGASTATSYPGVGVYRSIDGGEDWDLLAGRAGSFGPSDRCSKILVHPNDALLVYVSGRDGIARWDEPIGDWRVIYWGDVTDIALDRTNPRRLYAAVESGEPAGPVGIVVTDDAEFGRDDPMAFGGPQWDSFGNGLVLPMNTQRYTKLAFAPSDPRVLYASVNVEASEPILTPPPPDPSNPPMRWKNAGARVYRWDGSTWIDTGTPVDATQEWWCNAIAVHPNDPDYVVAAGVHLRWSPDGGANWYPKPSDDDPDAPGQNAGHADVHEIAFSPWDPNLALIANDGGLYTRTFDPAVEAAQDSSGYASANDNLVTAQFYNVSVSETPSFEIGGSTQDNGILRSSGGPPIYYGLDGNEGGIFEIPPSDEAESYWDPWDTPFSHSEDATGAARRPTNGLEIDGNLPAVTALAVHPDDPRIIVCTSDVDYWKKVGDTWSQQQVRRVHRTTDGAADPPATGWVTVVDALGSPGRRVAFAPSDPERAYLITDFAVWRSDDAGQTWAMTTGTLLISGTISGLAVDWTDPDTVFVSTLGGVVSMTADGGTSWRDISGSFRRTQGRLGGIPVHSLVQHRGRPETLYAASEIGVFRTTDGGDWWQLFNDGLPNVVISDMDYRPSDQMLFVSTIGRGMWRRRL